MPYLEKYNRDDIHPRAVIVGLINMLNQEIFIVNTHSNEHQEIVEVPFYYSSTGDERYLQDYFLEWRDCVHPKFLDGNFDPIPRGVVNLSDLSINTGNLTQRWIRGNFSRIIDGKIQTYNAYLNSIPIDMTFDVAIRTDTITDSFKIMQAVLEVFYRVQIFNTTFKGLMIPCQVGFPESYPIEKAFEFAYPADSKIEMTFSLSLETYFPIFDEPNLGSKNALNSANIMKDWVTGGNSAKDMPPIGFDTEDHRVGNPMCGSETTYYVGESRRDRITIRSGAKNSTISDNLSDAGKSVRRASNRMQAIIFEDVKVSGDPGDTIITLTSPIAGEEYTAGEKIPIRWVYEGFIHKVDIYYSLDYGQEWNIIERLYPASQGECFWTIPNITGLLDVLVINDPKKGSGANIKALVDVNGSIYDTIILNSGDGYDQTTSLEIESDNGNGAELVPSIIDGKIVDVLIRKPGDNYNVTTQAEVSFKIISSIGTVDDYLKDEDGNIGVVLVK